MGYCCYMLGYFYQCRRDVVEKDLMKAKQFYEKGVEMGSCLSMYYLARTYEEGEGVEKDVEKAIQLYQRSSDLGLDYSNFRLYLIYKKNSQFKDDEKSVFYLHKYFLKKSL